MAKISETTTQTPAPVQSTVAAPTVTTTEPIPKVAPPGANPMPGQETNPVNYTVGGVSTTTTPPSSAPISTTDLTRAGNLPDASTLAAATQPKTTVSDMVTKIAGTTLDSTGKAIDALRAQQEKQAADQIATEKAAAEAAAKGIASITTATPAMDALKAARDKFRLDENINALTDIQTKIKSAQEALNMGLIYEADRPVREQLILGRSASLQKQGLATIGALQATAQIIQGNIDMAKTYADATISAVTADNKAQSDALNTLLKLHTDNLVTLNSEEKSALDARIKAIIDDQDKLEKNKNAVTDLMISHPIEFQKAGVTLLDTKETAYKKMLPFLSVAAQAKLTAATTNADGPAADKQQMLTLKDKGMTYQEAVNAFGNSLSLSWIASAYGQQSPGQVSVQEQLYSNFLNPDGTAKPGYKIENVKNETTGVWTPQVVPDTSGGGGSVVKPSAWNPFSWAGFFAPKQ